LKLILSWEYVNNLSVSIFEWLPCSVHSFTLYAFIYQHYSCVVTFNICVYSNHTILLCWYLVHTSLLNNNLYTNGENKSCIFILIWISFVILYLSAFIRLGTLFLLMFYFSKPMIYYMPFEWNNIFKFGLVLIFSWLFSVKYIKFREFCAIILS